VIHGFDNKGDVDARFLAIISPGLLGPSFFEEIAAVLSSGGPPDVEKSARSCVATASLPHHLHDRLTVTPPLDARAAQPDDRRTRRVRADLFPPPN
jgi:hypothetical protein